MLAACTSDPERTIPSEAPKDDGAVETCNCGLVVDPNSAQERNITRIL